MLAVAHPGTTTFVIPVKEGHQEPLDELLTRAGIDRGSSIRRGLAALGTVHYARFVVLPSEPGYGARLAFESNHDGDDDEHLEELVMHLASPLDELLHHCEAYPPARRNGDRSPPTFQERVRYLRKHVVSAVTPYRGHPNLPVAMIRNDLELRKAILGYVDAETRRGGLRGTPREIRDAIRRHVDEEHPHLERGLFARELPSWFSFTLVVTGVVLGVSGLTAGLLTVALELRGASVAWAWLGTFVGTIVLGLASYWAFGVWVRRIEEHERPASDRKRETVLREPDRRMRDIFWSEDRQTQNALTHVAVVKTTQGRGAVLWIILTAVRLLAKTLYVRGKLGSIDSIHCARWVAIDRGRRLLFFSNYDGSWESYLGEFVDKLPFWLTAVWSNTGGFPTTTNRFESRGARDEEWFKRWTRARQVYTQVWYAAYPNMSVQNVNDNAALREGLTRDLGDKELREWLRLM